MAFLKKKTTPGSAEGDLHWDSPDDVVEVPDELAVHLLRIPGDEFSEVLPEAKPRGKRRTEVSEPAPDADSITE